MAYKDNARLVFEQYWLHARHVENERLWMTNVFAIIFAGLLGFMGWKEELIWYIAAFGLALSLFGLLAVHALRIPFIRYSRMAETIMDVELGLGKFRRFFKQNKKDGLRVNIDKFWSLHRTFVLFYCFTGAGWAALLSISLEASPTTTWIVFGTVAAALIALYQCIFWHREDRIEDEVKELSESLKAIKQS